MEHDPRFRARPPKNVLAPLVAALALGCATSDSSHHPDNNRELHRQAVAQLSSADARGLGAAELVRDHNRYIRVTALQRMQARAAQLGDAEVASAASVLQDEARTFDEDCRGILDAPEPRIPEQGTSFIRGRCWDSGVTPSALALRLLRDAPADRVVGAILAKVATAHRSGLSQPERELLRARGAEASTRLIDEVSKGLPGAKPDGQAGLLESLAFAAPGSGQQGVVSMVGRSLTVPDAQVQARASAALLRLTDRPDPAPWATGPRATAIATLTSQLPSQRIARNRGTALRALADIGPSATPLLDAVLACLVHDPEAVLDVVQAIGPAARRASQTLIAYADGLPTKRGYELDGRRAQILDTLVAIGASAESVKAMAMDSVGDSRHLLLAVINALNATSAILNPDELAGLQELENNECSSGHMVRLSGESAVECVRLSDAIRTLQKSNGQAE